MGGANQVRELFAEHSVLVDDALRKFFAELPALGMYQHQAYFMGFLSETLEPVEIAAGKCFRSSLCTFLGECYGARDAALPVALSIELYHNFTLIHDDIVDGDELRRGRATVWKLFGTDHAINSGDAQLLLALEVILESNNLSAEQKVPVQLFLTKQYRKVVEGQFLDFELTKMKLGDDGVSRQAYVTMIERKTADLIVAAGKGAGLIAGVSKEELGLLDTYARSLGMAYQICDDVVSIWGEGATTGKRAYGDLLERKKTLPVLHAHENLPAEEKKQLLAIYTDENDMTNERCETVISLLDSIDTKSVMRDEIELYAQAAKASAAKLNITEEKKVLLATIVDTLLPSV